MLFCGIDLHSNNSVVVVTDDADKVLYSRRLPNNLTEICDALSPYLKDLFGVVVESTYYARPRIMHGLSLSGLDCAA